MRRLIVSLFTFMVLTSLCTASPPRWITPGLVLIYTFEGGAATGYPDMFRSTGTYGKGYQIFVVHNVSGGKVYGAHIILLGGPGKIPFYQVTSTEFDVTKGITFWVDPKVVVKWLKEEPPENCRVSGNPGNIAISCTTREQTIRFFLTYDTTSGLITSISSGITGSPQGWSSSQAMSRYMSRMKVSLPAVRNFPPVAKGNHLYRIITVSPIGTMPTGNLYIRYNGTWGYLASFTISGAIPEKLVFGTRLAGPSYIHPSLLKRRIIIDIPQAGYRVLRVPGGSHGGVTVQHIWQGLLLLQQEYDPRTGLLLYEMKPMGAGTYTILELVR